MRYFKHIFKEFDDKYGIKNLMKGIYYVYSKPEQQWGFYARIFWFYVSGSNRSGLHLVKEIMDKDYFILTTNIDMRFLKSFPEDKICYFQGDEIFSMRSAVMW